jgi:hypothetical protein
MSRQSPILEQFNDLVQKLIDYAKKPTVDGVNEIVQIVNTLKQYNQTPENTKQLVTLIQDFRKKDNSKAEEFALALSKIGIHYNPDTKSLKDAIEVGLRGGSEYFKNQLDTANIDELVKIIVSLNVLDLLNHKNELDQNLTALDYIVQKIDEAPKGKKEAYLKLLNKFCDFNSQIITKENFPRLASSVMSMKDEDYKKKITELLESQGFQFPTVTKANNIAEAKESNRAHVMQESFRDISKEVQPHIQIMLKQGEFLELQGKLDESEDKIKFEQFVYDLASFLKKIAYEGKNRGNQLISEAYLELSEVITPIYNQYEKTSTNPQPVEPKILASSTSKAEYKLALDDYKFANRIAPHLKKVLDTLIYGVQAVETDPDESYDWEKETTDYQKTANHRNQDSSGSISTQVTDSRPNSVTKSASTPAVQLSNKDKDARSQ